ncbi:hypothetical protein [Actinomadura monticuli]|uniref:Nuclear transport factor 2 family protein n=1 Tax=Actinomadura monticuli TaxID=3097367 RepID=A0ABV4QLE1_9ACTN
MSGTDKRVAHRFWWLGVAVAILICSGCGGGLEAVALPSSTNSITPLPSSTVTNEDAVASAYTKFVAMLDRADSLPVESRKRDLATVMVDPQLSRVMRRIDVMKKQHITTYGRVVVHIRSVQLTSSGATVFDCQNSSGAGIRNSITGKKIKRGVGKGHAKALLVKGSDGKWRVRKSIMIGEGC